MHDVHNIHLDLPSVYSVADIVILSIMIIYLLIIFAIQINREMGKMTEIRIRDLACKESSLPLNTINRQ